LPTRKIVSEAGPWRIYIWFQQSPGVNDMSKEHKNKRDIKKKPALSPKEKKAAKNDKKDTKNVLGN
jgi:hypothetical protein